MTSLEEFRRALTDTVKDIKVCQVLPYVKVLHGNVGNFRMLRLGSSYVIYDRETCKTFIEENKVLIWISK